MTHSPPAKNRRVLVIDDNRAIHDDFRKILCPDTTAHLAMDASEAAMFGSVTKAKLPIQFQVDSAYQGQEGVLLVQKAIEAGQPYALAFVDVRMPPGMDGVETTEKIWAIDSEIQIVLCTAYSEYSWDEMLEKIGDNDRMVILKKPFDAVEAFQLAHALTEKWWLGRQAKRKLEELEGMVDARTRELAGSLSLLTATLESTTDGIVALDLAGKVVSYNSKFAATWKFPADMLARRDVAELRAHTAGQVKDPEGFLQLVKEMQVNPEAEVFNVIELKDERIFERYAFPQRIDGKCVGLVVNWRDITERKRAEEALRNSKQFLRSTLDALSAHIAILDEHGTIITVNAAWVRFAVGNHFMGGDSGVGDNYLKVCDAAAGRFSEEAAAVASGIRAVMSGQREEFQVEYPCHSPQEKRWFIVRGSRFGGDGPVRVVVAHENVTVRRRAEESLRLLSSAVEQVKEAIVITDAQLDLPGPKIIFINPAFTQMTGYPAAEVIGKTPRMFQGPRTDKAVLRRLRQNLERGEVFVGEAVNYHRDGTEFDLEWHVAPLRNTDGKVAHFVAVERDITARKLAENALRESNEKFQQLVDNITDVFWIRSPDLSVLHYVSPAFERLWGRTVASLHANPQLWSDFIFAEDRERVVAAFDQLTGDAPSLEIEYRIVRPDGEIRWVRVRGYQIRDATGKLNRHTGIVTDITERKKTEAAAAAFSKLSKELSFVTTPEEAARIIDEAAFTLLACDAFTIQLCSAETDLMTALFDCDTFDGKRIRGPSRPPHKPTELQRRILASGGQLILREQSGGFQPGGKPFGNEARPSVSLLFVTMALDARKVGILSAQSYTLNAYDQHDLRTLQTLADLCGGALDRIWVNEALRQSEAQLFQSQKLETVGKLAGGIAHEFNSILTAIIGQSELMLEDLPAGNPLVNNATQISKAATRAATLTRQLLAYGRGQFLRPETLDLNRVIAGMNDVLGHLMGREKVVVNIIPAAGLRMVKADAGQIEQIIMNLAMNARDAMPNGGKLTLETANVSFDQDSVGRYSELKPGDYVMLAISDTGRGMSEAVKARAFEPFFTTKDVGQGTGLGLSTCYGIAKQSGGHISVYSEPGRGTTFKVYLPQVEAQPKLPIQRLDSPELPRGTETILLVEDDPALRHMAGTLLSRLGYKVLTAANGVEALSLSHEPGSGRIELLFTDVVMPHMSGKELADRVRVLYPHTRILFTSAYTENAIVHQGALDQGVRLIQKPFTPSALARKVREVLDQPEVPKPGEAPGTSGFRKNNEGENTP
jgi:PAS domain S-box-containing protein